MSLDKFKKFFLVQLDWVFSSTLHLCFSIFNTLMEEWGEVEFSCFVSTILGFFPLLKVKVQAAVY